MQNLLMVIRQFLPAKFLRHAREDTGRLKYKWIFAGFLPRQPVVEGDVVRQVEMLPVQHTPDDADTPVAHSVAHAATVKHTEDVRERMHRDVFTRPFSFASTYLLCWRNFELPVHMSNATITLFVSLYLAEAYNCFPIGRQLGLRCVFGHKMLAVRRL